MTQVTLTIIAGLKYYKLRRDLNHNTRYLILLNDNSQSIMASLSNFFYLLLMLFLKEDNYLIGSMAVEVNDPFCLIMIIIFCQLDTFSDGVAIR